MHRSRSLSLALLAGIGLAGCADEPTAPLPPLQPTPADAPLFSSAPGGRLIRDRYIVVFNKDVADAAGLARGLAQAHGGRVHHTYSRALKGFAATLSPAAVEALQQNPNVAYVEQDQEVTASTTQTGATWGLDRADQRDLPLNSTYTYTPTGAGVRVYVIDTGIRASHAEFTGRMEGGYDAVDGALPAADCNGHGTHVAGTVGGTTYGIAKSAILVPVRVLDCAGSGSNSGVIAGVDWVTANHVKPAVANMSLGGGISSALDAAVANSIAAGVTYAVAAGNSNANACNYSPARVASALTVGSTTSTDGRSSFSNYGSCVDLFAPGSSITSAWYTGDANTNTISGTSMASPHVAGVAALYLSIAGNAAALPATVADAVLNSTTSGKVTGAGTGSPNRLLFSLLTTGGTTPPPPPPTAPCTSCTAFTGSLSGTGASQYQPTASPGYYYSSVSGTHRGWLEGPATADFDLHLQKWNGYSWATVARSESYTSTESISYAGTAGYYRYRVYSWSGSGAYTHWQQRP